MHKVDIFDIEIGLPTKKDCMKRDRLSCYYQSDHTFEESLKFEFEQGCKTLREATLGKTGNKKK